MLTIMLFASRIAGSSQHLIYIDLTEDLRLRWECHELYFIFLLVFLSISLAIHFPLASAVECHHMVAVLSKVVFFLAY